MTFITNLTFPSPDTSHKSRTYCYYLYTCTYLHMYKCPAQVTCCEQSLVLHILQEQLLLTECNVEREKERKRERERKKRERKREIRKTKIENCPIQRHATDITFADIHLYIALYYDSFGFQMISKT